MNNGPQNHLSRFFFYPKPAKPLGISTFMCSTICFISLSALTQHLPSKGMFETEINDPLADEFEQAWSKTDGPDRWWVQRILYIYIYIFDHYVPLQNSRYKCYWQIIWLTWVWGIFIQCVSFICLLISSFVCLCIYICCTTHTYVMHAPVPSWSIFRCRR